MVAKAAFALVFLCVVCVARHAHAAGSCTGSSVSNISFGSVSLIGGAAVNTTGTWTISCTGLSPNVEECLSLDAGSGGSSGALRFLTGPGAATLTYSLYQDAAHTVPWGSLTNSALGTVGGNPSSTAAVSAAVPIYAQITASQGGAAPGSYTSSFSGSQSDMFVTTKNQTTCTSATKDTKVPDVDPAFTVSATVLTACVLTTNALSFGAQSVLTANVDASTTMTVQCSSGAPYTIGLGNGLTGSGPTARLMTNGAYSITYGCYIDAARTNPWSTTNTVSGTGSGANQIVTVYGRVPPQTTPQAGTYSDSLLVTVSY